MVEPDRIAHLRGLDAHLQANLRGQDHLRPRVAAAFARAALAVPDAGRPGASLLLVGPTGTGKSETFGCACEYVYGRDRMTTFDMSEYQDRSAVNKLLGGTRDDRGLLGRALAALPSGGLLFDELEKAHPLVLDLLLQMLWRGCITVATGETFAFGPYIVGFTSNLGAAEAIRMAHSRFASIEQAVLRRVERSLRPEFVVRHDARLVFARLGPDVQRKICALEVSRETARLRGLGCDLEVTRDASKFLVAEGFHPHLGARPLRKTVESSLQDAVVRQLFGHGSASRRVVPDVEGRQLRIDVFR